MRPCEPTTMPLGGTSLIEASAGTGKTYTITLLVLRLVVEANIPLDALLVVTFTKAATAELQSRIYARLRDTKSFLDGREAQEDPALCKLCERWQSQPGHEVARSRIEASLDAFDRCAIFTIHGFCQRLLQEEGLAQGDVRPRELAPDMGAWMEAFAQDYWSRVLYDVDKSLAACIYQDASCAPQALLQVGQQALLDPEVELNVKDAWDASVAAALGAAQRFESAFEAVHKVWGQGLGQASAYYTSQAPKLSKTSYKPELLQRHLAAIDAWVQGGKERCTWVSNALSDAIDKLSLQGMQAPRRAKKGKVIDPSPFASVLDAMAKELGELQDVHQALSSSFIANFVHELRAKVKEPGCTVPDTFDGLLVDTRRLVANPQAKSSVIASTRKRYRAALVDEFQDTDPAQYEILHEIWGQGETPLILVGDPKQAIYRFRGADIFAYLHARRKAEQGVYQLTHNYRSHSGVIEAVNALFAGSGDPFLMPGLGFTPVQVGKEVDTLLPAELCPPGVAVWQSEEELKRDVDDWALLALVQRIQAVLETGRWARRAVHPGDLAVLCSSNAQAQKVRDQLESAKIPVLLRSGQRVWDSPQALQLQILLRAIAEPGRAGFVRAALVTPALGQSAQEIEALSEDELAWETWTQRFAHWRSLWVERGIFAMWHELCAQHEVSRRLVVHDPGLRALTNFEQLIELVHEVQAQSQAGPLQLLHEIQGQIDAARGAQEHEELRLASQRELVQVMTVHRSKGLEFPVVFCPFLYKKVPQQLPEAWIRSGHGARQLVLGSGADEEECERYKAQGQSEARRLLYVALTRARSHIELFWPRGKGKDSALGQILSELDADPLSGLSQWAQAAHASVHVAELLLDDAPSTYRAAEAVKTELVAPVMLERVPQGARTTSYSALSRRIDQREPERIEDELLPAGEPAPALDGSELRFAQLTPGARSGLVLHALLEAALDPDTPQDARVSSMQTAWQTQMAPTEADEAQVLDEVCQLLEVEQDWGAGTFRLGEIASADRRVEVEFLLDSGAMGLWSEAKRQPFRADDLAKVLGRQVYPGYQRYAQRLRTQGFGEFCGYIHGYIDLVARVKGRYFVVDYKSNVQDGTLGSFDAAALWDAAIERDYVLQGLVYALALHRRLLVQMGGYDPDLHLGDVVFLFVRGLVDADHGTLRLPMSGDLLRDLDALVTQPRPAAKEMA